MLGLFLAVLIVYWSVSCRRVYGLGRVRSAMTGGIFLIGLMAGHLSYRWVQFVVTFVLS